MQLFEEMNGGPVARLPHAADGSPRVPDGVRTFTLEQAARHFGWPESALRGLFATTFADVAQLVAAGELEAPPAAAAEAKAEPAAAAVVKRDLMRHYLYRHLEDAEFEHFLEVCRERGENPWLQRIIPEVRRDEDGCRYLVFITTIEFLRGLAQQTEGYAGQVGPDWCGEDGQWRDVWAPSTPPAACRVGIVIRGSDAPLWGVVKWEEVSTDADGRVPEHYQRMPTYMMGIRAEAAGIRRACRLAARLYLRDEANGIPLRPSRVGDQTPAAAGDDDGGYRVEPEYDQLPADEAAARVAKKNRRPMAAAR